MEQKVSMRDARTAGYCARGVRAFMTRYQLDLEAFRGEGLPASQLEATGDALALALVASARAHAQDAHG